MDQGYTGDQPTADAAAHGIQLEVVKLPDDQGPKRGFVLLPRRWVVERGFAWIGRLRRMHAQGRPVLARHQCSALWG